MRRVALLVAASAAFGLGPLAARLSPLVGALGMLALALLLAFAASASINALAAAGGALGALAYGAASSASMAAAGALLVSLCYAERTLRVRSPRARLTHVALAIAAGAAAGAIGASYAAASIGVRVVAAIVGAVIVATPLFVDADDPVAHGLDALSAELPESISKTLGDAVTLRRQVDEGILDRQTARQVRETWRSLFRLTEARARLERNVGARAADRAVARRVDQRIEEHVSILRRAYLAADDATAAEVSANDTALRRVEHLGESFEQTARVLIEQD